MGFAIPHHLKSVRRLGSLSSEIASHAHSLSQPRSLKTRRLSSGRTADLDPPLEWPDFLGNGLFVVFCTWVLFRALLSPDGFWVFLLLLVLIAVGLVWLIVELCRLAWRACFSRHAVR
jgi:hypothetical protein